MNPLNPSTAGKVRSGASRPERDVSVIICTYNRAAELQRTLEEFLHVRAAGFTWELLVVDNNSKDETKAVCASFGDKLPIRYVFEERQGKSFALNRSISEAASPLLLFTDDDVSITPDWILSLHDAAQRHPEFSFFGGRVVSRYAHPPPKWFLENEQWLLINPHIDWGEAESEISDIRKMYLVGANLAVRKAVFGEGVFYREDLGPSGRHLGRHARHGAEDYELQCRLLAEGFRGLYVPYPTVDHRNPPHRATEKFIRWWYKQRGREDARLDESMAAKPIWCGAPRYLWREFLASLFAYCATRCTRTSKVWLGHECKMALKWGAICEFRAANAKPRHRHIAASTGSNSSQ